MAGERAPRERITFPPESPMLAQPLMEPGGPSWAAGGTLGEFQGEIPQSFGVFSPSEQFQFGGNRRALYVPSWKTPQSPEKQMIEKGQVSSGMYEKMKELGFDPDYHRLGEYMQSLLDEALHNAMNAEGEANKDLATEIIDRARIDPMDPAWLTKMEEARKNQGWSVTAPVVDAAMVQAGEGIQKLDRSVEEVSKNVKFIMKGLQSMMSGPRSLSGPRGVFGPRVLR